jgi:hypothetical protein
MMNKKWSLILLIIIITGFISYIIIDLVNNKGNAPDNSPAVNSSETPDKWDISKVFDPGRGQLNAVAVSKDGKTIILGGELFIACYDPDFKLLWEYKTEMPVSAITISGNNVYAAVQGIILVLNSKGEKTDEWGPFEDNPIITSLTSNEFYVVFADAANKAVFILDKNGTIKSLIGKSGVPFIIPSNYFDVAIDSGNTLFIVNPGNRRIEKRNMDGTMINFIGKPGTLPGDFCGCCNPAHFTLIPGGFVTAEKGINRIKIINKSGEFVEFISSVNNFVPPLPLDIATADGKIIYGANPADSKLYVFKRK